MISSNGVYKLFFLVLIVGASNGQMRHVIQQQERQQQLIRDHNELALIVKAPKIQDYAYFLFPNSIQYNENSLPNVPTTDIEQYNNEFQKPIWHQLQHFQRATATENGKGLSAREIAMEIFPPNIENRYDDVDVTEDNEHPQFTQNDAFELLKDEKNNIRRQTNDVHRTGVGKRERKQTERLISKNSNCDEDSLHFDDTAYDNENDASPAVNVNWVAMRLSNIAANNSTAVENDDDRFDEGNIRLDDEWENPFLKILTKRIPMADITANHNYFRRPQFPVAYKKKIFGVDDQAMLRSNKRERIRPQRTTYIPSISTGAITHLGHFFNDLSKNVRFNERNEFYTAEAKLLQGDHPLHMLQDDVAKDSDEQSKIDKTADFLQSIRSYRPSQKIRSLVSMNPQGYHGSNFLDPNYMWVGLG